MLLFIENLKDLTNEQTNKHSINRHIIKWQAKKSTHRNQCLCYMQIIKQKGIFFRKSTIHNCYKKTKYLGINLLKEVKDLYKQKYKILVNSFKGHEKIRNTLPMNWKD